MRATLLAQWQTAACLMLALCLSLVATGLPGYLTPTLFTDCLLILVPSAAGVVAMRRGRRRLALGCGMSAAALSALLFWWVLYASVAALVTAGSSAALTAPLEGTVIAALLVAATATLSSATGTLWHAPLPRRHRLNSRGIAGTPLLE